MAYLLAWLGFNGRQIDDQIWRSLVDRARQRVPLSMADAGCEFESGTVRAFAAKVRRLEPDPLRTLADGRLILCDSRFEHAVGQFEAPSDEPSAVILIDSARASISLLRDRLGQQPLVWVRLRDGILAASKESILLGHPEVSRVYDREYLAAHLAFINPPPGRSMYAAIRAIEPGSRTDITATRDCVAPSSFEPDLDAYRLADTSAIAHFRDLLENSVHRNCEGVAKLGITLSSGLDSSSVAALLPEKCRTGETWAVGFGTTVNGSYDEREFARTLSERIGIQYASFDAADYPPGFGGFELGSDPGFPLVNPCRAMSVALYRALRDLGVDVYLTGHFADFWSPGPRNWLRDAVSNRRWDVIAQCYRAIWASLGLSGVWRDPGWRSVAAGWLGVSRAGRKTRHMRPEWRGFIADCLARERRVFAAWPHPERAAYNLGTFAATESAYIGHYREMFGVQARHPFREWKLLRFCLSLPAYQGTRAQTNKWIARAAVANVLPSEWSMRLKRGGLGPMYEQFFRTGGIEQIRVSVCSSEDVWESYIDRKWVRKCIETAEATAEVDAQLLRLAGFGTWLHEQGA